MLEKTLLSIGLASGLKTGNWKHSSAAVMAQLKADLISDSACYPSAANWYSTLEDALAQKPATGMYEDASFLGDTALYSVNFVGDGGVSSIAGPSDADLVAQMDASISGWQRPSFIDPAGDDFSLWGSQGILPAGTAQGGLGDCWFLAACAAVAETPARIQKVFANRGKDPQGFYAFEFYVLGDPIYITLDDRLPIQDAGAGYAWGSTGTRYAPFASGPSENGAWWQPILEKAYAKYTNTYAALNGGNEWEAFRAMSGMPVQGYSSGELTASEIYDLIADADQKNYVMSAGCHYSQYGLISGHAYSLIGVNQASGNIVVRNPWGREEYTGPGSDQTDDGQFEVPPATFKTSFTEFTILMYKDWQWTSLGKSSMGPDSDKSWNIYNEAAQEVVVTFDLAAARMAEQGCDDDFSVLVWAHEDADQTYETTRGWVMKSSQGGTGYKMAPNLVFESLDEGWYSVGIKGMWNAANADDTDFNVHVYSADSAVHLYDGDNQVSTLRTADYVPADLPALTDADPQPGVDPGPADPTPPVGPNITASVSSDSESEAAGGGSCVDGSGRDAGGDTCSWYTANPYGCGMYNTGSFNSQIACCACGGGSTGDSGGDTCVDGSGADAWGDTCAEYNQNVFWCGLYDSPTFSSNDLCCGCGGGV